MIVFGNGKLIRKMAIPTLTHALKHSDLDPVTFCRLMVIQWFLKKNCVFLRRGTKTRKRPRSWQTKTNFCLHANGHTLDLTIHVNLQSGTRGMYFNLLHSKINGRTREITHIVKVVFVPLDQLPSVLVDSDNPLSPSDEAANAYNKIYYSLETEFYHNIIQPLWENKPVRNPPLTPRRQHIFSGGATDGLMRVV